MRCARSGPEICRSHWAHHRTLLEGIGGNLTLRYTGVRLRADALVASALQESAGGAKQQQQQQQQPSYYLTGQARYNNKITMYSNSTLKHCTEYYLKNVRFDAVMSNAQQMAHFRPIIVMAGADLVQPVAIRNAEFCFLCNTCM